MGWASRLNKFPLPPKKRESGFRKVKVHIPNSSIDLADAIFMGMVKGLRPMTPDERAEALAQGMDMRPPDIIKKERDQSKFAINQPQPEIEIIRP